MAKRWTDDEVTLLCRLYLRSEKPSSIADQLHRSKGSVAQKILFEQHHGRLKNIGVRYKWQRGKYKLNDVAPPWPYVIIVDDGLTIKRYAPGYARGVAPDKDAR